MVDRKVTVLRSTEGPSNSYLLGPSPFPPRPTRPVGTPEACRPSSRLGDEEFNRSHRSALVHKDPDFYASRVSDVPDDLPYVWPVPTPGEDRAEAT